MTALPAWRQRLAAVAVLMPHSFSVRLEPDDACWIRAPAAVMAVHESNFHAPCCEACGKEWGKTVPTAESDPFVTVLTELHVQPPTYYTIVQYPRSSFLRARGHPDAPAASELPHPVSASISSKRNRIYYSCT